MESTVQYGPGLLARLGSWTQTVADLRRAWLRRFSSMLTVAAVLPLAAVGLTALSRMGPLV